MRGRRALPSGCELPKHETPECYDGPKGKQCRKTSCFYESTPAGNGMFHRSIAKATMKVFCPYLSSAVAEQVTDRNLAQLRKQKVLR